VHGQCLCGKVRFEIVGQPPFLYQCHCSLCRKQSGSSSNTAAIVANEQFRWLAGEEAISSWTKATGFRADFCSTCGSPVPNPLRTTPYYWVPAGLLDGDNALEVRAHLFLGSKAAWDVPSKGGAQYESSPALREFIQLLRHPPAAD
jgi:hypothetical protein